MLQKGNIIFSYCHCPLFPIKTFDYYIIILGKIEEGCKYHFYGDGILGLDLRPIVGARVSGLRVGETGLCPAEPPAMEAKAGTPKSGEWRRNLTGSRGPGTVEKDLPSKLKKLNFLNLEYILF